MNSKLHLNPLKHTHKHQIHQTDTETIYSKVTQNILDEYGNGQIYTYAVKATLMGFQSAEVAKRIIGVYNLPLQPDEFTALTRTQAHLDLFREAQLLPGNSY